MNNTNPNGTTTITPTVTPLAQRTTTLPRWAWATGGVLLLAVSGLATALVYRGSAAEAEADAFPQSNNTSSAPARTAQRALAPQVAAARPARAAAPVCADCGVVESVQTVQRRVPSSGVGAVAGTVLGGAAGAQMGEGSGKTAMTVLGAIGGAMAGNEVEKRTRAETVVQVQVRMDDGSRRTLTLPQTAVARGDRVAVEGSGLRRLPA